MRRPGRRRWRRWLGVEGGQGRKDRPRHSCRILAASASPFRSSPPLLRGVERGTLERTGPKAARATWNGYWNEETWSGRKGPCFQAKRAPKADAAKAQGGRNDHVARGYFTWATLRLRRHALIWSASREARAASSLSRTRMWSQSSKFMRSRRC
jgi:hypothetical protein